MSASMTRWHGRARARRPAGHRRGGGNERAAAGRWPHGPGGLRWLAGGDRHRLRGAAELPRRAGGLWVTASTPPPTSSAAGGADPVPRRPTPWPATSPRSNWRPARDARDRRALGIDRPARHASTTRRALPTTSPATPWCPSACPTPATTVRRCATSAATATADRPLITPARGGRRRRAGAFGAHQRRVRQRNHIQHDPSGRAVAGGSQRLHVAGSRRRAAGRRAAGRRAGARRRRGERSRSSVMPACSTARGGGRPC